MLNDFRAAGYARQRDIQFTAGEVETQAAYDEWLSDLLPRLTGPQRRRIKHSRKEHVHEKGVRCLRCKPAPQERPAAWRAPDRKLEEVL